MIWTLILTMSCAPSFYDYEYEYQGVKIVRDYMCDPYKYLLTFPEPLPKGLVDFTDIHIVEIDQIDKRNLVLTIKDVPQKTIHKFIRAL